jgi:hypothetical protein
MAVMPVLPPPRLNLPGVARAPVSNDNWDGSPITLDQYDNAMMPQTANGSMVVAWQNVAPQNSDGSLVLSSGGTPPQSFDAPALALAPTILVQNWGANDLKITNLSPNAATPIWVEAYGPGIPGRTPIALVAGAAPTPVKIGDSLQGIAAGWTRLILQSNSNELALFAVIWGPLDASGNNAYVFAVNFPQSTAPPGYTNTTMTNTYNYQFYGNSRIYVAYFGPGRVGTPKELLAAAQPATVTMLSL